MSIDGLSDIIPLANQETLLKGRAIEIRQALMDLGYWDVGGNLQKAIFQFREEFKDFNLLHHFQSAPFSNADLFSLDALELQILQLFSSLDGDFKITEIPSLGVQNITTRILHYRLEILGLYDGFIGAPFSNASNNALVFLQNLLDNQGDILATIQLAGDIPELIKQLLIQEKLKERIVVFKYENPLLEKEVKIEIAEEADAEIDEAEIDKELQALAKASKFELKAIDKNLKGKERKEKHLANVEGMIHAIVENQKLEFQSHLNEVELQKDKLLLIDEGLIDLTNSIAENKSEIISITNKINALQIDINNIGDDTIIHQRIEDLQTRRDPNLIHLAFPQLSQITNDLQIKLDQTVKQIQILTQEIDQLGTGKKRRLKRKEKRNLENELEKSQTAFFEHRKETEIRKGINQLVQQLKSIQPLSSKIDQLSDQQAIVDAQILLEEKELKDLQKSKKKQIKNIDKAILHQKKSISHSQNHTANLQEKLIKFREKISKLGSKFNKRLKESLRPQYYQLVLKEVFHNRNTTFLENIISDPINNFLTRLIQVHQWTNGYYYGKLDSDIKGISFDSIREITKDVKQLRLKFILSMLGDSTKGYWILNVQYFLEKVLADFEKQEKGNTVNVLQKYEEHLPELENNTAQLDKIWIDYNHKCEQDILQRTGRRIYYGVRSIATSILRCFARLIKIVLKVIGKTIFILHNFVKFIYREIREGAIKFGQGMSFLFGKRQIQTAIPGTNDFIITKYDFDFDAILFCPENVDTLLKKQHGDLCKNYANHLNFSVVLVAKVLKWVFRGGVSILGWWRLAIHIAIQCKNLIKEWLKELHLALNQFDIHRAVV